MVVSDLPWYDGYYNKKFRLKSVQMTKKYILHRLGANMIMDVTRSSSYLSINYVNNGNLVSHKIKIPASVLYCLDESDFDTLISDLKNASKNTI